MKYPVFALATLTALSACGGSSSTPTPPPAPTTRDAAAFEQDITSANLPDQVIVDYSEATDTFSFSSGGTALNDLDPAPAQDAGRILAFRNGDAEFGYLYRSDGGQVGVFGSDDNDPVYRGAQLVRFGTTEVPLSGASTYTGDYAALVGIRPPNENSSDVRRLINGDVSLTANFANNTVSGSITNRSLRNEFNGVLIATADDVVLSAQTLDADLRFTGAATGGAIDGGTASNGTYQGALVGADGNEALGVVVIEQDYSGQQNVEWGAFVAD